MSSHGTDATACPVCGTAHASAQESCRVRLGSEPDRTRLDTGPFGHWTGGSGASAQTPAEHFEPGTDQIIAPPSEHTSPISVDQLPAGGLEPGAQIGEFIIEGQVGAGGMGVVYRATHPLIGKKAVIKVIKASLGGDAEHVQRFIREARAVNQIGHPNIVDVFSFGTLPDKRPYLVMEWLQGESLAARLERGKILVREAIEILVQICSALDAAHTYGVIHRDLKPDNVYLVALPNDDRPLVKLLDFGLAKITEATKDLFLRDSEAGVIMGTPSYLSPEVARGTDVDHRSDIYTLGVLAFEMFSGRRPFVGSNPRETIFMHITAPPPSVRAYARDVPEVIESLLLEMMAKNPAQRPTLSRVRAVLGGIFDGSQQALHAIQDTPEEERTGARTADFKPMLREIVSKRRTEWGGDERASLSDLDDRPPDPPREDATRTDTDLLAKLASAAQDSGATPSSITPVGPSPQDAEDRTARTEKLDSSQSSQRISGVGILVRSDDGAARGGLFPEAAEEADATRLRGAAPIAPISPPARAPVQRRLGSMPSISEDLLPPLPPSPPARSDSRASFDPPKRHTDSRLDAALRSDSQPRADAASPTTSGASGSTGSVPSLPRLPIRSGYRYRLRRASSAAADLANHYFHADAGRTQRIVILACVLLLPLVLLLLPRLHSGGGAATTTTVHTEVRLWVRGLPADSTLAWGGKVLASNPTSVPRSNDPVQLTIFCPGFEPIKIDLTPSSDLEFSVELVPLRRTH